MDEIICCLNCATKILVTSHTAPDGDAVGSLLAMGLALDAMGKDVVLYNESQIPAVYRFLPGVNRIVHDTDPSAFDTAVVLDCSDLARIGKIWEAVNQLPIVVNIDHHITNAEFGTCQLVETNACATTEIVYRLISAMKTPISQEIATCIYTGILTDTGSFRFSNTNPEAFEISSRMIALGVNPFHVAQHVYGTYSLGRIKLLNLALDSIEISPNRKISLMSVTQNMLKETGTQLEDADGLINYAKRIQDVRVAVMIQEMPVDDAISKNHRRHYHVSLRSDGTIDVAAIATRFGGGGHANAAGFSVVSTLQELKSNLLHWMSNIEEPFG
ncbi:DHH family phosphoesterase [Desulfatirhabdium butyrativorans]|uniref:DHH family phosphoesterase n=1 Tax=Desulfatirhabdium butyrativorans TaxID=340467 RepID=UPI000417B86A|nr:bifunctional oligoribonuclease/PAP phosphatase NrnA [Desulfatirhabdium butyrativorans]